MLGNEQLRASLPGEIVPGGDFYDYADKYLDGKAALHAPADLPDEVTEEVRRLAVEAARTLYVEGLREGGFPVRRVGHPVRPAPHRQARSTPMPPASRPSRCTPAYGPSPASTARL